MYARPVGGPAFPQLHRSARANEALRSPRPSAARRTRVLWRRPRGARCNAARRVASRSAAQRGRDAFFCRRFARRARCLVAAARRRSWRRRWMRSTRPPVREQTHARARRVHTRARANEWPGRGRLS
jgi:hypothetical protein